jgi:hypothetical protein
MAGNNAASDRPPALEPDRGDDGGNRNEEDVDKNDARDVIDAVARAFRDAADAHLERIRRALGTRLTPELVEEVQAYAEERARLVRECGRPCPRITTYARELIEDAYADTWTGDLAWDPDSCSLATHLRMAIKRRTWREIERSPKFVSLDTKPSNDNDAAPVALVDTFASSGDISTLRIAALVAQLSDELGRATVGDRDCAAVLRAWQRGLVEREEILLLTGLSANAYKRARKRLMYAASNLPTELRQLVQDYLRST